MSINGVIAHLAITASFLTHHIVQTVPKLKTGSLDSVLLHRQDKILLLPKVTPRATISRIYPGKLGEAGRERSVLDVVDLPGGGGGRPLAANFDPPPAARAEAEACLDDRDEMAMCRPPSFWLSG